MKKKSMFTFLALLLIFSGCGKTSGDDKVDISPQDTIVGKANADFTTSSVEEKVYEEMFTDKDLEIGYEPFECISIMFDGSTAICDREGVLIEENRVTITEEGTYIISGEFTGSIVVETDETKKVRLILNNVSIQNKSTAPLYLKQADKVLITLASGSTNSIINTGEFVQTDDNNVDGAIFAKCDLSLNGNGKLSTTTETGNGIVCKDDLVLCSGTYDINAAKHGLEGKDSVRIANANIQISCGKDGIHSDSEEEEKAFIYIADGMIDITESNEGMEARVIEIAGGKISIVAKDDGLNAASDNKQADIYILITDGKTTVRAQGDGVDSNGYLYVTGGEVYVSGTENAGNGALDFEYGGQITGGTVVAAGAAGMAVNFGDTSTQGSILVNTNTTYEAGTEIALSKEDGEKLLSYTPTAKFSSVVVSCKEIEIGKKYVLTIGNDSQTIEMEAIIYGEGNSFGGKGPGGMHSDGDKVGRPGKDRVWPDGEMPQPPDGEMPQWEDGEMPPKPERKEMPEYDMGKEDDL